MKYGKTRRRLGDLLIAAGILNAEQLEAALGHQAELASKSRMEVRLGSVVVELGFATEEVVAGVLAEHLGVPFVGLSSIHIDPELSSLVPRRVAVRNQLVPISRTNDGIEIAMADPTDLLAIDDVRAAARCDVSITVATPTAVAATIDRVYAGDMVDLAEGLFADPTAHVLSEERVEAEDETATLERSAQSAPIVRLVGALLTDAVYNRATDIHIEPQPNELKIRYRVDGLLRESASLPRHIQSAIVSRLKIMGGMDIAERRRPQDGSARISVSGETLDIRMSTVPTTYGERVVIRLLPAHGPGEDLDGLGFDEAQLAIVKKRLGLTQGLIVFTGPTGSGKTTTMYAGLSQIRSPEKNIVTIEDPVEYQIPGLNQVVLNERAGVTFKTTLRSILRQDPDVIMVGEMRDVETAEIVIQAAATGHLVLSTMHTADAVSVVTRFLDLGIEPFRVASALTLVVAQRLVRKVCDHCARPTTLENEAGFLLGLRDGDLADANLRAGAGCNGCDGSGFKGRVGLYEVLPISNVMRMQMAKQAAQGTLEHALRASLLNTLRASAIAKLGAGLTTAEEILRVLPAEDPLDLRIQLAH